MQKTKFKIQGIKCGNCSLLIEERLKNKDGVIKVKVDQTSNKGVVVYDEQKITEQDIYQAVENINDFYLEKIEEMPKIHRVDSQKIFKDHQLLIKRQSFSKTLLFVNIVFLMLNLILLNSSLGKGNVTKGQNNNKNTNNTKQNVQLNNPSPSQQKDQETNPTGLQTFSITKDNHIRGDFNAEITLVEFSDFECPFCERHYPTVNKILSEYEGKVRLVYKHFPLGFHKNAQKAAEASECAAEQGKFWEYHDKLFENQPVGYSLEKFKQWAKDTGLNTSKFNNCLDSGKFAQKVKDDYQEGVEKGVNGTPATFVNGKLVSGAVPYNSLKEIIDNIESK